MASLIKFLLSNYSLTLLLVGLICASVSILRHKQTTNRAFIIDTLLAYYCLCVIGLYYLYNFVMHAIFSEKAASFIGWQTSPFQKEVGFASLGFAMVGFLAFRRSFELRLAAVTGPAMFLWGAAIGHVYQMVTDHNFSPGNAGVVFWTDWLLPVIGFALLRASYLSNQSAESGTRAVGLPTNRLVSN